MKAESQKQDRELLILSELVKRKNNGESLSKAEKYFVNPDSLEQIEIEEPSSIG